MINTRQATAFGFLLAMSSQAFALVAGQAHGYGLISAGLLKTESKDMEAEAYELELGVKGSVPTGNELAFHYQIEVDVTRAANAEDSDDSSLNDIELKEAIIRLPTNYGMFLTALRGTSGFWRQLYGPVNTFEYNEARAFRSYERKPAIFSLNDRSSGTFAYASPELMNFRVITSAITLKDDNDQDADGLTGRIIYQDSSVFLGLGVGWLSQNQLPDFTSEDYMIVTTSAGLEFEQLKIGMVWEHNDKQPFLSAPKGWADSDAFGVSTSYQLDNGHGISLGYREKVHDYKSEDNSAFLFKYEKTLTERVKLWAETGQYEHGSSNYALGVNISI